MNLITVVEGLGLHDKWHSDQITLPLTDEMTPKWAERETTDDKHLRQNPDALLLLMCQTFD